MVATLVGATKNALKEHLPNGTEPTEPEWRGYLKDSFRSVWIGLAGLDRAGQQGRLAPKLAEIFGLDHTTANFRLTTDVELLPAVSEDSSSVVVLIAGTGSVAMRYTRREGQYVRVARSGGWGHILGDEGGGYSIGLDAIKHTLGVLEEMTLGLHSQDLSEFEDAIIRQLGCHVADDGSIDLLTDILSQNRMQNVKARIAGVAETVLKLAPGNKTAMAIVEDQVASLVNNALSRLVDPRCSSYVAPEESEIVLAGGLMKNEGYQQALQRQFAQRGLNFRSVLVVDDVAAAGAKYLSLQ